MPRLQRSFLSGEEGIAASEYALLLGLTLLLLFIVVRVYGRQVSAHWTNTATEVFAGPSSDGSGGNGNSGSNGNPANNNPANNNPGGPGGSGPPGNPNPGRR